MVHRPPWSPEIGSGAGPEPQMRKCQGTLGETQVTLPTLAKSESKGMKTQASCGQCPQGFALLASLGRRGPAFCVAWHQPPRPARTGKWPSVDIKAPEDPCLSFCPISRAQQCVHFKIMITRLFGKIQRPEFMSKYSRTKQPKRTQLCAMTAQKEWNLV